MSWPCVTSFPPLVAGATGSGVAFGPLAASSCPKVPSIVAVDLGSVFWIIGYRVCYAQQNMNELGVVLIEILDFFIRRARAGSCGRGELPMREALRHERIRARTISRRRAVRATRKACEAYDCPMRDCRCPS